MIRETAKATATWMSAGIESRAGSAAMARG